MLASMVLLMILFQSTRPRGRTRRKNSQHALTRPVSIHASSREDATIGCDNLPRLMIVSIHASSREDATVSVESNINQNVTFAKARRK